MHKRSYLHELRGSLWDNTTIQIIDVMSVVCINYEIVFVIEQICICFYVVQYTIDLLDLVYVRYIKYISGVGSRPAL